MDFDILEHIKNQFGELELGEKLISTPNPEPNPYYELWKDAKLTPQNPQ